MKIDPEEDPVEVNDGETPPEYEERLKNQREQEWDADISNVCWGSD